MDILPDRWHRLAEMQGSKSAVFPAQKIMPRIRKIQSHRRRNQLGKTITQIRTRFLAKAQNIPIRTTAAMDSHQGTPAVADASANIIANKPTVTAPIKTPKPNQESSAISIFSLCASRESAQRQQPNSSFHILLRSLAPHIKLIR